MLCQPITSDEDIVKATDTGELQPCYKRDKLIRTDIEIILKCKSHNHIHKYEICKVVYGSLRQTCITCKTGTAHVKWARETIERLIAAPLCLQNGPFKPRETHRDMIFATLSKQPVTIVFSGDNPDNTTVTREQHHADLTLSIRQTRADAKLAIEEWANNSAAVPAANKIVKKQRQNDRKSAKQGGEISTASSKIDCHRLAATLCSEEKLRLIANQCGVENINALIFTAESLLPPWDFHIEDL